MFSKSSKADLKDKENGEILSNVHQQFKGNPNKAVSIALRYQAIKMIEKTLIMLYKFSDHGKDN
jgi:hypothetical protein